MELSDLKERVEILHKRDFERGIGFGEVQQITFGWTCRKLERRGLLLHRLFPPTLGHHKGRLIFNLNAELAEHVPIPSPSFNIRQVHFNGIRTRELAECIFAKETVEFDLCSGDVVNVVTVNFDTLDDKIFDETLFTRPTNGQAGLEVVICGHYGYL